MSDRQSKIYAVLRSGRLLRTKPKGSTSQLPDASVGPSPGTPPSQRMAAVPPSQPSAAQRAPGVSLPYIPTHCTPERPVRPDLEIHPTVTIDSDRELLGSPPPAPPVHSTQPSASWTGAGSVTTTAASGQAPAAQAGPSASSRPSTAVPLMDFADFQARLQRLEAEMRAQYSAKPSLPQDTPPARCPENLPPRRVTVTASSSRGRSSFRQPARRAQSPRRRSRSPLHRTPSPSFHGQHSSPEASPSRASVFSRLGRRSRSPSPGYQDDNEVSWSALVDLGLTLSGQAPVPDPAPSSGTGLLAKTTTAPAQHSFPPSTGVLDALHGAFDHFANGHDLSDVQPSQLPGDVTTKVPFAKFGSGFRSKFHGGDDFPLTVKSLNPTPEEKSFLRPNVEPSVPIIKCADIEFLLRKNIRTLSSLDWLLRTLQEVTALPHQDGAVLDSLWSHIRRTLAYSTDFTAGALVSSIVLRREAFLKSCDPLKVPRRTHTWANLRPPFHAASTAMLGDAASVLRSSAREDREMHLMSSLSSRRPSGSRGASSSQRRGTYSSNRSDFRTRDSRSSTNSAQQSRAQDPQPSATRGRRRGFRGSKKPQ